MKTEDLANKEFEITDEGFLKVVEVKKEKYIPKYGELYWYIDDNGFTNVHTYENDMTDQWIINHFIVFRTEEEAEEYKRYLDVLDEYKYKFSNDEWKDDDIEKWYLIYDYFREDLNIDCNTFTRRPSHAYFKSKEDAEDFIKEAGIENIKKFMFDVWE